MFRNVKLLFFSSLVYPFLILMGNGHFFEFSLNKILFSKSLSSFYTENYHPYHISKCDIDYKSKEQTLQITLHLFIDDVEVALKKRGHEKLFLCTDKESPDAQKLVEAYIREKLLFKVNNKPAAYAFLGKEMTKDMAAMYCYIEIDHVKKVSSLTVTDKILIEQFEDQKNIVQISMPDKKHGYFIFDASHDTDTATF